MTNCYFSKMAAIIYPTHMFCNMTLLLSRWCRAYFSTPSNPDGPMAALREHSDPPPGTALNHPSRFYSLKTLALGKYFSCKPSYMTRWLLWDDCGEKPWRTTDPYGAREQRHQKCRQRSHHRSGSSRSSLCHMERNNDLDELFPNYWHVQSQAK